MIRKVLFAVAIGAVFGVVALVYASWRFPKQDSCERKGAVSIKTAYGSFVCIRQDVIVK